MANDAARTPAFAPDFYPIADLPRAPLREGITGRFVTGERIMFSFVQLEPGAVMADHAHPHEQLGYVIEGVMILTIAGERRELRPGDAYAIPGGVRHEAIGGPGGCLALDAFAPPREEYLAIGRSAATGGE